jgi:hypothetical protein
MDGLATICLPHEQEPHEWDVVAVVQAELANGLVGEDELVYPLKEIEVSEHQHEFMQIMGALIQHLTELTENDFE